MINVIICDDNDKDRSKEEDIVKEFMNQNNKQFELFSFDDYNKKFFATCWVIVEAPAGLRPVPIFFKFPITALIIPK